MALATTAASIVVDAALGVWLGSIVFFSFVAAPRVFAVLDRDRAGSVVNDVFPRYYAFGLALGAVALLAALARGVLDAFDPPLGVLLAAVAVGIASNAYARWVLIPKMESAGEDAFERYHARSVALNALTMVAVAVALVASHF